MIIAKMTQNQAVSTDTTEECGAVVSVPPNTLKKSLRAVWETLCGAASDGEKRGAWDHGFAARIVALRSSGAPIPIRFSAKKAHDFAPFAGPTAAARSGGRGWSEDRYPHLALDGRAPDDRLVENRTTVRSGVAEAGRLPCVKGARQGMKSAFRAHLGRTRRAFRSQRSGLFSFVAMPIRPRATVVRWAVRSSLHNQDGQFQRSQSGELCRFPAWADRSAACTTDRWQDKRPRGAAMGGCGFSDAYRMSLHIAPYERSLQTRPFSSVLNCLARCAAFAP
jgi:hypothetical protein